MNSTPISMKQHLTELALKDFSLKRQETYPQYQDFQACEKYSGECPLVFSFDYQYLENQGWMQLMDGYLFLVPLLYSAKEIKPHTILPRLALNILPAYIKGFHYSTFNYTQNSKQDSSVVHVILEYYEDLTSKNTLEKSLERVRSLCTLHSEVKLVLNSYLIATGKDQNLSLFLNGVRNLPQNCHILSISDYAQILNLHHQKVLFIYDEDVLTHSVWEEMTILKNGIIEREVISKQDTLSTSFDVYPRVKRDIYFHEPLTPALDPNQENELKKVVDLLKNPAELLDHNYRRLIRDIIEI